MTLKPNAAEAPGVSEIDITEEMLKAGAREMALRDPMDNYKSTARDVYLAMECARRSPERTCPE